MTFLPSPSAAAAAAHSRCSAAAAPLLSCCGRGSQEPPSESVPGLVAAVPVSPRLCIMPPEERRLRCCSASSLLPAGLRAARRASACSCCTAASTKGGTPSWSGFTALIPTVVKAQPVVWDGDGGAPPRLLPPWASSAELGVETLVCMSGIAVVSPPPAARLTSAGAMRPAARPAPLVSPAPFWVPAPRSCCACVLSALLAPGVALPLAACAPDAPFMTIYACRRDQRRALPAVHKANFARQQGGSTRAV